MNNFVKFLQNIKNKQPKLAALSLAERNLILKKLAALLESKTRQILSANAKDLKGLKREEMRDRLALTEKRIQDMAEGLIKVAKQPDPLKEIGEIRKLGNGLKLEKVGVPLGTIAVIYESRPNVTIDLACLALKSGNALVLKGGTEAYNSNKVLTSLIHRALDKVGMPKDLVYLISPKEDWQKVLLNAHGLVDVIIPRGGAGLIKWVRENSRIPTIETGAGVCHTFVDGNVDVVKASKIIINAKTQRPSVCNALDTLVIHKKALMLVMEKAISGLAASNVVILADIESYKALKNIYPKNLLQKAKRGDFGHEFLSLKMSIKTVKSFEQGLEFVKENTSGHSEAILSRDSKHIKQFLNEVDAAVVYANASTRFTDGEEFGMGAEVGISTQKLHARGPMGLEALTSYKWIGKGDWIIRK